MVTRDAYLRLYPDDETKIRLARWVVINGRLGRLELGGEQDAEIVHGVGVAGVGGAFVPVPGGAEVCDDPTGSDRGAIAREFMDEMGFTETSGRSPPLGRGSRFATACPRMEMTATTSPPPRCARMA